MILTYTELEKLIAPNDVIDYEKDVDMQLILTKLQEGIAKINYRKRERRIDITDIINGLHNAYTNETIKDIFTREVLSGKNNYVDSDGNILRPYLLFEYNLFDTYVPKSYRYDYESPYLLIKLFSNYIELKLYRENRKNTIKYRNIKVIAFYSDTQTTVVYLHSNFND